MTAAAVVGAVLAVAGLALIDLVLHRRQRLTHERRLAEERLAHDARVRALTEQVAQHSRDLSALERWLDGTPAALALFDRDLRFVRVNQQWADLSGVAIDAHRGRAASEFPFSDGASSSMLALLRAAVDGVGATPAELSGRSGRDGTARSWLFECVPLFGEDGRVTFVASSIVDVTERARRDAQQSYRRQMEAAARLASGIAHDFNNSFGVIAAYASMTEASRTLDAVNARRVCEIVATVERAGALTRQLLAFGQPDAVLAPPVDVNGVLRRVAPLVERIVPERIVLDMRVERQPAVVAIDPDRLEQILIHLVTNAVHAMPHAGTLLIETAHVDLRDEHSEAATEARLREHVLITVTDTGIGMDEPTLRRLFEPFFTTKPASPGSGLGLATVYDAVSRAGGTIWPSSEVGRGTVVRVYLPLQAAGETGGSTPSALAGGERHLRILLVSDDSTLAPTIAELLGPSGYVVRCANDSGAAMSVLENGQVDIDLVLADGRLPAPGVSRLRDAVRERYPDLPLLVTSERGAIRDSAAASADRPPFRLTFPCTREQLTDAIAEVLNAG